jgi:uncharacterized membrane protein
VPRCGRLQWGVPRTLAVTLTAVALAWCAIVVTAPAVLAGGPPHLAPAAASVYYAAGRICHQRPERSFRIAGVQLPVCARCFGLYAAGAAGALLGWTARARPRRPARSRRLLIAAALPTFLTFSLEFAGLAAFSNAIRFAAAVPLGVAAGWLFIGLLNDEARPGAADAVPLRG